VRDDDLRRAAAAALAAASVALAILVDHGVFHGVDQYAVDHWMPWLSRTHHPVVSLRALFVPAVVSRSWLGTLVDLATYPASAFPSAVVVGLVALRVRRPLGTLLVALWVAANVVELAGKLLVERPSLTRVYAGEPVHIAAFDHSLPSGHTLRAFVVATALAAAWRWGRFAFLWAAAMPFALVALGAHAPLDVVAGVLAYGALVLALPVRPSAGSGARAAAAAHADGDGAGALRRRAR
jgi:membrane-associated phospholipid phosphatase